jgi:hypothetical protein
MDHLKKPYKLQYYQERLITIMEHHEDLNYSEGPETLYVPEITPAGQGSVMPELDLGVQALIVIMGATVRWNWNFWQVKRRCDTAYIHVAAFASFDHWQLLLCGRVQ